MTGYEKSLEVMNELFGKDVEFSLATSCDDIPSVRMVDIFYGSGSFWIVTYKDSNKAIEIKLNPNVALCKYLHRFKGKAYCAGHPLDKENKEIRGKLIKAFKSWYFVHNNENDENMCYIRVDLQEGFFYKDGMGYKVDFKNKTAEEFPFSDYIISDE